MHTSLKLYASPAQLNKVIVLLSIPADFNQSDRVEKINNIGHSDLVEKDPFYQIWSQVTYDNYHELENFKTSGLGQQQWPKLECVPSLHIEDYINQYINGVYQ